MERWAPFMPVIGRAVCSDVIKTLSEQVTLAADRYSQTCDRGTLDFTFEGRAYLFADNLHEDLYTLGGLDANLRNDLKIVRNAFDELIEFLHKMLVHEDRRAVWALVARYCLNVTMASRATCLIIERH